MRRYVYEVAPHKVEHGVLLDLHELTVDERAQRALNEQRAQKLADDWVPEAAGSLTVSDRGDGVKRIIDGYHRCTGAKMRGIKTMPCEVHYGLSVADEAALFLLKNRESSKPNALDEYRIGLTAELPLFVDTEKVLIQHNLTAGKASSKNIVGAVQAILRITEQHGGPENLDAVLGIAEAAWGRTAETWDGMLIGGLGLFLHRHGNQVDTKDLISRLRRKEAWAWKQTVLSLASNQNRTQSGTGSRVNACYHELVRVYNKGRRNDAAKITAPNRG
jgi:hypothetical protein